MTWQDAVVAVFGILLIIIVASVLIWQIFRTGQVAINSEAAKRKDASYMQAIADSTAAQQVTANRLAELSEGVADLQIRVASIEKLLKEVE